MQPEQPSHRIGLVGLGLAGAAIAARLLAAGLKPLGFDLVAARREELVAAGGEAADTAAPLFAACRRIIVCLPTTQIVKQVLDEAAVSLAPRTLIVDATTGDPRLTARLGVRLAGQQVRYLEATLSGSSEQIRQGQAVAMVGGPAEDFLDASDLLEAMAVKAFHVGGWGSGAAVKLVSNLVLGLNRAALAEGLALAECAGLELPAVLEVLRAGAAFSRVMDAKGQKMVERDFTPQARLAQHLKDVRIILDWGGDLQAALPLSQVHERLLSELSAAGWGDLDNSAILKAFERPRPVSRD